MSKTPEELAQQYTSTIADTHSVKTACEKAFIAGYKAAKDQLLAQFQSLLLSYAETSFNPSHTAWQIFDTLKEGKAAKDQLADVGKVIAEFMGKMPENFDTAEWKADWFTKRDCGEGKEHQVCWESFVTGYKSAAPQWISVKDSRPEPEKVVLAYNPTMFGVTTAVRYVVNHWLLTQPAFGTTLGINGKPPVVTHWMPLPEPPKEEG